MAAFPFRAGPLGAIPGASSKPGAGQAPFLNPGMAQGQKPGAAPQYFKSGPAPGPFQKFGAASGMLNPLPVPGVVNQPVEPSKLVILPKQGAGPGFQMFPPATAPQGFGAKKEEEKVQPVSDEKCQKLREAVVDIRMELDNEKQRKEEVVKKAVLDEAEQLEKRFDDACSSCGLAITRQFDQLNQLWQDTMSPATALFELCNQPLPQPRPVSAPVQHSAAQLKTMETETDQIVVKLEEKLKEQYQFISDLITSDAQRTGSEMAELWGQFEKECGLVSQQLQAAVQKKG